MAQETDSEKLTRLERENEWLQAEVEESGVVSQYQTEIPEPRVERIEFRIHQGYCRRCRQPVQGRHHRQSSTAVGSAASQVGPRAVALATPVE